jgi:hypothetical protein
MATENNTNVTPEGSVTRNENIDITSLLKTAKEDVTVEPVREKSNLEKLKEAKSNGSLGMVVDNQQLESANEEKQLIQSKTEDDALRDVDEYTREQDKLIEAAKLVKVVNKPKNELEMVSVMDALSQVAAGNVLPQEQNSEKVMLIPKGEDDSTVVEDDTTVVEDESAKPAEDDEKQHIVNILIDKTGLGGDFKFTDEEKEKLFTSTEIRLKEVEEVDLSTIKIKKREKSFIDSVNEFQISSSKVPVVFPASRFKAYMTGLSYGEMGDISLNSENVTFDQIHKKLTVIYNKMSNPSIGKFENFEDFLRKFSYMDIDLAVYGLVVATFPEVDDITLTCNNNTCKQGFNHKFSPRTLIRFDKCDKKFLEAMRDVIDCPAEDALSLSEESPTRTHKRIKLPMSNFIIEIGIASSYDYLYTIVDNLVGEKFKELHPDDVNGILQLNSTLLGLIRTVYVPDVDGEYVEYDDFEDMINALYHIKPEEVAILSSLLTKFTESYTVNFELFDIVCPHCGAKTEVIPLDVNYLVFLKYQRLMSTEVNIDNISAL